MSHIYGHRWSAGYGERAVDRDGNLTDVAKTWSSGLSGITGEQVAQGLRACVDRGVSGDTENAGWPPSLPEFRALCLPERRDPIHRDYVALPRPPQKPGTIEQALRRMRELLR